MTWLITEVIASWDYDEQQYDTCYSTTKTELNPIEFYDSEDRQGSIIFAIEVL